MNTYQGLPKSIKFGMIDTLAFSLLVYQVLEKKNIIVCGPTGSGKTTLLNDLVRCIPSTDHFALIEDSREITCADNQNVDYIQVNPKIQLSKQLSVEISRIVIDELRIPQHAAELCSLLKSDYNGSMFSIHADTPENSIKRLKTLSMGGLSTDDVEFLDIVNTIVFIERRSGNRHATIYEIFELNSTGTVDFRKVM